MRIASFRHDGLSTYGVVRDGYLVPVPGDFRAMFPDLRAVLGRGALAELAAATNSLPGMPVEAARFEPVVPGAGRVLCVGINYLAHIREMGRERPDYPTMFVRFADSLTGHEEPLVRPRVSDHYDYEGELAIVIGRCARYVTAADALQFVAGYTCFMDGSIRDFQRHTSQFIAGKNFPRTGSVGPWLVTSDELPDVNVLELRTRVNGDLLQSAPIGDLCFKVPEIVAYCSTFCALQPGDIIATGTPSGVGFARTPPRWLCPGDVVEVEISGIGILRNTVIAED